MWAKQQKTRNSSAFTIVELLIVIVVIAILAAITIVAYNGIQDRAKATAASQALSNAAKKIKLWQVEQDSTAAPASLAAAGISNSGGVTFQYTQGSNGAYCITASTAGKSYNLTETGGTAATGACSGHADGGMITNLVTNPSFEIGTSAWWSGWATGGAGTATVNTNGGFSGANYKRMTWSTAPTGGTMQTGIDNVNATAGKTYTYSFYIRASWAGSFNASIQFRDASNTALLSVPSSSTTLVPNQWTRLTTSGTAPANTTKVTIYTNGTTTYPAVNGTLDIDAVMLNEGSSLYGYADGSSTGWGWDGTVNSSTSTGPPL